MKKTTITLLAVMFASVVLAGCAHQKAPMTEAEQAASYNMTLEEYREEKQAAARMNMSIEEHMKMLEAGIEMDDMDHGDMDM